MESHRNTKADRADAATEVLAAADRGLLKIKST